MSEEENTADMLRPVYNYDDLVEGKPRMCKIRRSGEDFEYDRLTETTNKEKAGVGEEEKVVLNMLSDLAQDTVVILGKDKIKAQTEDDLKAKNLEWECFKKKNEDWKEMLAYQRANPICITLDGEEVKKGSSKKSSNKRSSQNHTNDSSEEKKSKLNKETSEMKVKKIPELPRSPRKEGSVLHPYFKKKP